MPPYFLPRPPMPLDAATIEAFDRLFAEAVAAGAARPISYALAAPKWQFLCYVCEHKGIVLHGSGDPNLGELRPRKANDVVEFGDREAIYAATDGIWPIYFAIVDRGGPVTSLINSAFRIVDPPVGLEHEGGPYYFFSIGGTALTDEPWREGMVYLLPGETFERQARWVRDGLTIEASQAASLVPARPLAKLRVAPSDFPFLDRVRRHDPVALRPRAEADPDGFPWLDEPDA
jgi:hypothetical protein